MEVRRKNYDIKRNVLVMDIEMKHPIYQTVQTRWRVQGTKAKLKNVRLLETSLPKEEHERLKQELRENEVLRCFAIQKTNEHFEAYEKKMSYQINSVKVLSADTKYVREVRRNGSGLANIEEMQKEIHDLFLLVEFDEIEKPIPFELMYSEHKGYTLKLQKTSEKFPHTMKDYLFPNWQEEFKPIILEKVREKVHFLLPEETQKSESL